MQPAGTTTTTEIWQWQCTACQADWKMLRQVTTTCCPHGHGHGCRCCPGTPASAGNPPLPPHHRHRLHQEEGTRALPAQGSNTGSSGRDITLQNPARPGVAAQLCWVPDAYLMVQQLREFESLNDELVALRVQLQEYADEIERSIKRDNDGTNWLLDLPANVRDVLVMARDTIESFIAISATALAH
ncbi:hypothetical protein BAE44_0013130 [Dichanthelium oligosanthes]|uniref:Uncharacterized protein n=1 Tax=Dichanthelium oligosanthes TaxID=888268 RepID=A0A1E5VL39_9POAL|nr:hypothetical protein BAE44_0013130 [Dichanthelium oligosanthes]